jgi:hypothetical protein
MKYLLALIGPDYDSSEFTPEQMAEVLPLWQAFEEELRGSGAYIAGEALEPSTTATTVRIGDGGERTVTDGPFVETKEKLGGFYLIDVATHEEAVAIAEKVPLFEGAVELRAIVDFSQYMD